MNLGAGQPASLPYGVEPQWWYSYHSMQFSTALQQSDPPFSSVCYPPPPSGNYPPPLHLTQPNHYPPPHHFTPPNPYPPLLHFTEPNSYPPPPTPNPYSAYAYHPHQPSYPHTQPHFIPTNQVVPPHITHEPPPPIADLMHVEPDPPLPRLDEFMDSVSRLLDDCISKCMRGIQVSECSSPSMRDDVVVPTQTPKSQSSEPRICSPLRQQPIAKPSSLLGGAQSLNSSPLISPVVHSHLYKARCKQVPITSTAATGGVKKHHSFGLGASTIHKIAKYQKRSSAASLLLDDAISAQSNHNPTSLRLVSGTGSSVPNLNFVNNDCGHTDYVTGAMLSGVDMIFDNENRSCDMTVMDSGNGKKLSEHEGIGVKLDGMQGPYSGECHALKVFDKTSKSDGFCNAGRRVAALASIRDKGGGLAHQPKSSEMQGTKEASSVMRKKNKAQSYYLQDTSFDNGSSSGNTLLAESIIFGANLAFIKKGTEKHDQLVGELEDKSRHVKGCNDVNSGTSVCVELKERPANVFASLSYSSASNRGEESNPGSIVEAIIDDPVSSPLEKDHKDEGIVHISQKLEGIPQSRKVDLVSNSIERAAARVMAQDVIQKLDFKLLNINENCNSDEGIAVYLVACKEDKQSNFKSGGDAKVSSNSSGNDKKIGRMRATAPISPICGSLASTHLSSLRNSSTSTPACINEGKMVLIVGDVELTRDASHMLIYQEKSVLMPHFSQLMLDVEHYSEVTILHSRLEPPLLCHLDVSELMMSLGEAYFQIAPSALHCFEFMLPIINIGILPIMPSLRPTWDFQTDHLGPPLPTSGYVGENFEKEFVGSLHSEIEQQFTMKDGFCKGELDLVYRFCTLGHFGKAKEVLYDITKHCLDSLITDNGLLNGNIGVESLYARDLLSDDISGIMGYVMSSLVDMSGHCGIDIEETVMISRGLGNSGQISSVADSSFFVEIVGLFACDGDPGSNECVLIYANGSSATEVPQFGKIDFGRGFSNDDMHKSGFMLYRLGSMTNFATLHEVIVVNWNVSLLAGCSKSGDVNSGHQLWDNIYVTSFSSVTSCFQNEINMEPKLIFIVIAGLSLIAQHEVIPMQPHYATMLSCCAKLAYSSQGEHVQPQLQLIYGYVLEFHDQMSSHYKSKTMKYLREHLKSSNEVLLSVWVIRLPLVESAYQTELVMTLLTSLVDEFTTEDLHSAIMQRPCRVYQLDMVLSLCFCKWLLGSHFSRIELLLSHSIAACMKIYLLMQIAWYGIIGATLVMSLTSGLVEKLQGVNDFDSEKLEDKFV